MSLVRVGGRDGLAGNVVLFWLGWFVVLDFLICGIL